MLDWLSSQASWIVVGGAVLAAAGGWLASRADSKATEKLLQKTEENARLQQEFNNWTTGGDSWCYLTFGVGDGSRPYSDAVVHVEGNYPLRGVWTRVVRLDSSRDPQVVLEREFMILYPPVARDLGTIPLPQDSNEMTFIAVTRAQQRIFSQQIKLKRVDDVGWRFATIVRDETNKILYEQDPHGIGVVPTEQ